MGSPVLDRDGIARIETDILVTRNIGRPAGVGSLGGRNRILAGHEIDVGRGLGEEIGSDDLVNARGLHIHGHLLGGGVETGRRSHGDGDRRRSDGDTRHRTVRSDGRDGRAGRFVGNVTVRVRIDIDLRRLACLDGEGGGDFKGRIDGGSLGQLEVHHFPGTGLGGCADVLEADLDLLAHIGGQADGTGFHEGEVLARRIGDAFQLCPGTALDAGPYRSLFLCLGDRREVADRVLERQGRVRRPAQVHDRGDEPALGGLVAVHIARSLHVLVVIVGSVAPHVGEAAEVDVVDGEVTLPFREGFLVGVGLDAASALGDRDFVFGVFDVRFFGTHQEAVFLLLGAGIGREGDRDRSFPGTLFGIDGGDAFAGHDGPVDIARHGELDGGDVRAHGEFILGNPEEFLVRMDLNDIVLVPDAELGGGEVAGIAHDVVLAGRDGEPVLLVAEGEGLFPVLHGRAAAREARLDGDALDLHAVADILVIVGVQLGERELEGCRDGLVGDDVLHGKRGDFLQVLVDGTRTADSPGQGVARLEGDVAGVAVQDDTVRRILDERIFLVRADERDDGVGESAFEVHGRGGSEGALDVADGDGGQDGGVRIADVQGLDAAGGEIDRGAQGHLLLDRAFIGRDLEGELAAGSGGEGLDAHIDGSRSVGGERRSVLDRHGSRLGHERGVRGEDHRILREIDIERTDDVLRGGEFHLGDRDGGFRVVLDLDGQRGGDVLHRNLRRIAFRDVLRDAEEREARGGGAAGQVGHAVVAVLHLGGVGAASDVGVPAAGIGRRRDLGSVGVQEVPVVGIRLQGDGTRGDVVLRVRDREFLVLGIGGRAGRGVEDAQLVIFDPLGGHPVIDGTGVGGVEDDLDGTAVQVAEIGFPVATDNGKGGSGQTRKEKGFFHHNNL